jgi:hypothetical protein
MPAAAPSVGPITAAFMAASVLWKGPNTAALAAEWKQLGASHRDIHRVFRTFNAAAEPFRKEAGRARRCDVSTLTANVYRG